jgi:hypothetical protein
MLARLKNALIDKHPYIYQKKEKVKYRIVSIILKQ